MTHHNKLGAEEEEEEEEEKKKKDIRFSIPLANYQQPAQAMIQISYCNECRHWPM